MRERLSHQLLRYCIVGLTAVSLDLCVFRVLTAHSVAPLLAAAASYPLATVVHFSANRSWTFNAYERRPLSQLPGYAGVVATGWGVTVSTVALCTGALHVSPLLAKLIAIAVTLPMGFLGHKHVTFGSGVVKTVRSLYERVRVRRFAFSSRALVAFLVCADAAIFAGGTGLARYSFSVAVDPRSSAILILALLLANFVLLTLLFAALAAGGIIVSRLAGRAMSRIPRLALSVHPHRPRSS